LNCCEPMTRRWHRGIVTPAVTLWIIRLDSIEALRRRLSADHEHLSGHRGRRTSAPRGRHCGALLPFVVCGIIGLVARELLADIAVRAATDHMERMADGHRHMAIARRRERRPGGPFLAGGIVDLVGGRIAIEAASASYGMDLSVGKPGGGAPARDPPPASSGPMRKGCFRRQPRRGGRRADPQSAFLRPKSAFRDRIRTPRWSAPPKRRDRR